MARGSSPTNNLTDTELFDRICQLAQDLKLTIARQGWTGLAVEPSMNALHMAIREAEARRRLHQAEAREQLCEKRFGRYSDDELAARIARLEQEIMSAMEVSGPPELIINTLSEQLRCACLVASKRPSLWGRLVAEGHCRGQ